MQRRIWSNPNPNPNPDSNPSPNRGLGRAFLYPSIYLSLPHGWAQEGAPEHDASSLRCDRHDMHLFVEGEERALAALMGHHLHTHNNTTVGGWASPGAHALGGLVAWWR